LTHCLHQRQILHHWAAAIQPISNRIEQTLSRAFGLLAWKARGYESFMEDSDFASSVNGNEKND